MIVFVACSESDTNTTPPGPDGGVTDGATPLPTDGGTSDASDPLADEVARRFTDATAKGFSGSANVTVRGRKILAAGYGKADRTKNTPNGVETAFDFGSVMKDLTAAAIFDLEGAGKLTTSKTLGAIFTDVPTDKAAITVLQLLQHRAGFDEYHDTEGDFEAMTRLEARARIFEQELRFAPGTDEAYSNSGFTLLADIVETVSGMPFVDYVRTRLFVPAGMSASGFPGDSLFQNVETAIGYEGETFGENDPAAWPYTWALVGNGGLVTTVGDLDRWVTATREGRVLSPAAFEAYRTNYLAGAARELEGAEVYAFAGAGDYGLGGLVLDCPERDTRIVIASNAYDAFAIEPFAIDLARLVLAAK